VFPLFALVYHLRAVYKIKDIILGGYISLFTCLICCIQSWCLSQNTCYLDWDFHEFSLFVHVSNQLHAARVLLEKLAVTQLVKKFPPFYENWRFITMFMGACQWCLSWVTWIQSTYSQPISPRYILILSSHLCLSLPKGLSLPLRSLPSHSSVIWYLSMKDQVSHLHKTTAQIIDFGFSRW
jgi:hypothetical protein